MRRPALTRRAAGAALAASVHALAASAAPAADSWTTFRGDPLRTGNPGGEALPPRLELEWSFRDESYRSASFDSSPALAEGLVLIGLSEASVFSPSGRIVCLDAATGKRRWHFKTRHPVFSSPVVAGGRVYAGEGHHQDSSCKVYCLDQATGEERWSFETRSHVESTPTVDGDRVYVGAGEDGVHALGAADGKPLWHAGGEHVDMSPLVTSGLVFVGAGYENAAALCLSAKDGAVRWRTPLDQPCWGSPVRAGNRVYFGLGRGNFLESDEDPRGGVVCLSATQGAKVWQRDLPDAVHTAIAFGEGKLFCGSRDSKLYALDPGSGEILWKVDAGSPVVSSPIVGPRSVAAVGSLGRLVVVSAKAGEIEGTTDLAPLLGKPTRFISSPAFHDGRIIIGSGGSVIALRAASPKEGKKP
jgi:outer membrane protein assembly factor BamB